jgi:hypothetical protein
LDVIGKLFYLESIYKKEKQTATDILKRRNTKHPPILKELKALFFNHVYKPGSALEGAVIYAKNIWYDLSTYLTSGSYDGARYTTLLFSIIRTTKINDLIVSKYLKYVLDHI